MLVIDFVSLSSHGQEQTVSLLYTHKVVPFFSLSGRLPPRPFHSKISLQTVFAQRRHLGIGVFLAEYLELGKFNPGDFRT